MMWHQYLRIDTRVLTRILLVPAPYFLNQQSSVLTKHISAGDISSMAGMIHDDDLKFTRPESEPIPHDRIVSLFERRIGLVPLSITSPRSSSGVYHKIYFVSLGKTLASPQLSSHTLSAEQWAGREVILRVARKAIPHIKVRNEIGCLGAARSVGVPVPQVLFFSDDAGDEENGLGYEYIAMERRCASLCNV